MFNLKMKSDAAGLFTASHCSENEHVVQDTDDYETQHCGTHRSRLTYIDHPAEDSYSDSKSQQMLEIAP